MNRAETAKLLPNEQERRFFVAPNVPMLIDNRPVAGHPNHREIAISLIEGGLLGSLLGLSGGYCITINGILKYWAPTAGSIPDATKSQFDQVIDSLGANVIT
ncbi:hypothetical protein HZC27_00700 [Candidatus Roizmanbacteria bacterium]|nr:hypothetical protein [Candidatus Roizmanbacteria bacterium]